MLLPGFIRKWIGKPQACGNPDGDAVRKVFYLQILEDC